MASLLLLGARGRIGVRLGGGERLAGRVPPGCQRRRGSTAADSGRSVRCAGRRGGAGGDRADAGAARSRAGSAAALRAARGSFAGGRRDHRAATPWRRGGECRGWGQCPCSYPLRVCPGSLKGRLAGCSVSTEFGKVRPIGAHRAPYKDLPRQSLRRTARSNYSMNFRENPGVSRSGGPPGYGAVVARVARGRWRGRRPPTA